MLSTQHREFRDQGSKKQANSNNVFFVSSASIIERIKNVSQTAAKNVCSKALISPFKSQPHLQERFHAAEGI
jgi:hypothetical protein